MHTLRTALLVCLCTAFGASVAAAQERERGWLDINFGIAAAADDSINTSYSQSQFGEQATYGVGYHFPRGASFDVGGGVMFTPLLGAGVSVTGTAHMSTADLAIRIPHPNRFNSFATDATETEGELERTEGGINLQLMLKVPIKNDKVRVRFFGGPTYFRLSADAVSEIRYDQVYQVLGPGNSVTISTYDTIKAEETGWGFHAGGDVAVMFTKVFGLGGFARFSGGTVTVSDADILADDPVDVKVGGFQAGGGIRLRF